MRSGWPPPPGWPPEVTPPFVPPERPAPGPPPMYPPVPVVYDRPQIGDDLTDRLLDRRMVLVSGVLDQATASDAAGRLLLLDGSGDDPIDLVLSCPDGDLVAAMALADTVELVGAEVRALCSGAVGGPAVLPFALATRRVAQPHATFRLRNPHHEVHGRADDLAGDAERHASLVAQLHQRFATATNRELPAVVADFAANRVLDATQAKDDGLVDEIARRRILRSVS